MVNWKQHWLVCWMRGHPQEVAYSAVDELGGSAIGSIDRNPDGSLPPSVARTSCRCLRRYVPVPH